MNPGVADFQAVLATPSAWLHLADFVQVCTGRHQHSSCYHINPIAGLVPKSSLTVVKLQLPSMSINWSEFIASTLLVVGALFPIVNPLGNAPIFLVLTRGVSADGRAKLARTIAVNGFVLMVVSIFIGTHILGFFGISLPVVQVGGGLVVIATGWALLRHSDEDDAEKDKEKPCNEMDYMRRAFYPLTLPLTVGPGSISVAITVGANRTEGTEWQWPLIAGFLAGAGLIGLSIYLSYRFAERIARALGETVMNVVIRLSSFILVCIGVQILWNGLSALLRSVLPR
jgi:multiple antibiotic resistance protein